MLELAIRVRGTSNIVLFETRNARSPPVTPHDKLSGAILTPQAVDRGPTPYICRAPIPAFHTDFDSLERKAVVLLDE